MENEVCIYVLVNSLDDTPFYVGQTKNPKARLLLHKTEAKKRKRRGMKMSANHSKIVEVLEQGGDVTMEIVERIPETKAYINGLAHRLEDLWVRHLHKQGVKLTNRNCTYTPHGNYQWGWPTPAHRSAAYLSPNHRKAIQHIAEQGGRVQRRKARYSLMAEYMIRGGLFQQVGDEFVITELGNEVVKLLSIPLDT